MIKNNLKTTFLLAALSGLIMCMGALIGGTSGIQIAFIMALVMNGILFFFSDRIVLSMYHAQPLHTDQYAYIHEIVEELCHKMALPKPRLWLIKAPHANAFATGRSPAKGSIALTQSIITLLEPHELRGVLAHELSHIKNRDILISTIAATLATTIGYLGDMIQRMIFWRTLKNDNKRSNTVSLLISALLMPLIATLLQLAISRSREYGADECGAHYAQDPLALASALKKLHQQTMTKDAYMYQTSTASLFIVNPFLGKQWTSLFATHPPITERIKRLEAIFNKNF